MINPSGARTSSSFQTHYGSCQTVSPYAFLFRAVFFFAAFFVLAFPAVVFFGAALALGMDFGLQSRDWVVARRPQLSQ
jgi:hypothetical protein